MSTLPRGTYSAGLAELSFDPTGLAELVARAAAGGATKPTRRAWLPCTRFCWWPARGAFVKLDCAAESGHPGLHWTFEGDAWSDDDATLLEQQREIVNRRF